MVRLSRRNELGAPGSGMNRCILVMFQYIDVGFSPFQEACSAHRDIDKPYITKFFLVNWEFVCRNLLCGFPCVSALRFNLAPPHETAWNGLVGIQLYWSIRGWGYQLYQVINLTRILWTLGELHSLLNFNQLSSKYTVMMQVHLLVGLFEKA